MLIKKFITIFTKVNFCVYDLRNEILSVLYHLPLNEFPSLRN